MKNLIYDVITKETTIVEVPDVVIPIEETIQPVTVEERISSLEQAISALMGV